jgi:hypothetical protein
MHAGTYSACVRDANATALGLLFWGVLKHKRCARTRCKRASAPGRARAGELSEEDAAAGRAAVLALLRTLGEAWLLLCMFQCKVRRARARRGQRALRAAAAPAPVRGGPPKRRAAHSSVQQALTCLYAATRLPVWFSQRARCGTQQACARSYLRVCTFSALPAPMLMSLRAFA